MLIYYFCAAFALIGCGALGLFLARSKIRPIWVRVEELESQLKREHANRTLVEQSLASALVRPDIQKRLFTSQYGEDLLIWCYFNQSRRGYFVEIGGYDGVTYSNTYALEMLGWEGVVVEADPELYSKCVHVRTRSKCIHAAVGKNDAQGTVSFSSVVDHAGVTPLSFVMADEAHRSRCKKEGGRIILYDVPYLSVNRILADCLLPQIDVLSVDIEGMELEVLAAIDYDRFTPRLMVVEANSKKARAAILEVMGQKGYRLWRETVCNLLLIPIRDSQQRAK
jgi:FkbM family methyltransferase